MGFLDRFKQKYRKKNTLQFDSVKALCKAISDVIHSSEEIPAQPKDKENYIIQYIINPLDTTHYNFREFNNPFEFTYTIKYKKKEDKDKIESQAKVQNFTYSLFGREERYQINHQMCPQQHLICKFLFKADPKLEISASTHYVFEDEEEFKKQIVYFREKFLKGLYDLKENIEKYTGIQFNEIPHIIPEKFV